MKNSETRLTTLDIKYINQILGRLPSNVELNFIELVMSNELDKRTYLQVLKRLNVGAKRNENTKFEMNHEFELYFHNGLKILDENHKILFANDEPTYKIDFQKDDMVLQSKTIYDKNVSYEKLIPDVKTVRHNNQKVLRIFNQSDDNIIFSNFFEVRIKDGGLKNLEKAQIFTIPFGKRRFKKHQALMQKTALNICQNKWIEFFRPISIYGLGRTLIDLINEFDFGITLNSQFQAENYLKDFGSNDDLSALIVVHNNNIKKLEIFCGKNNLTCREIGSFISDKTLRINCTKKPMINLPSAVFSLKLDVNAPHFPQPELELPDTKNIAKRLAKSSLNNQLLKLFAVVSTNDFTWHNEILQKKWEKDQFSYGVFCDDRIGDQHIAISHADSNYILKIAPRLAGRIAVASAARRLACLGVKPTYAVINNIFPNNCAESNWLASELMQGQEEAIRELDLTVGSRTIDVFSDVYQQNVLTVGTTKNNLKTAELKLENVGDFITLLGSHRGELGHSAYEHYISGKLTDNLPSVDLRMENRLQAVVQQGIATKLIKALANVGAGGILIAIAKLLAQSERGIGVRIHLSRKLKDVEILFGETQGIMVVVLSEIDIMEFERICMTSGVPSTTIGRITDNNWFTFNDLIKVNAAKFRRK